MFMVDWPKWIDWSKLLTYSRIKSKWTIRHHDWWDGKRNIISKTYLLNNLTFNKYVYVSNNFFDNNFLQEFQLPLLSRLKNRHLFQSMTTLQKASMYHKYVYSTIPIAEHVYNISTYISTSETCTYIEKCDNFWWTLISIPYFGVGVNLTYEKNVSTPAEHFNNSPQQ